jgi:hypothetical protein
MGIRFATRLARTGIAATGAAAVLALGSVPAAADPDVGCGLGTQVWEGRSGSIVKAFAATTNGTSGNQTFGVTSGTSGCSQGGTVTAQARVRMFAGANLDQLARDMAHGDGESLEAFAQLVGVSEEDRPAFFAFTQAHFAELYGDEEVTAGSMLTRLDGLLAADPELSEYADI